MINENNELEHELDNPLNPTVIKLGLVSFFADISSEMLYPITPLFLTTVLGASMTSVGFIEGCAEGIGSLLKTFSAVWSDRISKRKPFVLTGYFLSAVGKPLMGLATVWPQLLAARSLDRVGKGLRGAPRDALLTEAVSAKHRGAAFGWHRGMDTLGAAIGPLLTVLYLNYFSTDLRTIYYWALVPGLFSVLCVFLIKEKKAASKLAKERNKISSTWKELPSNYIKYLIPWILFSLVNSSDVFLLLKAQKLGVSTTLVILMYCFYNLIYALGSPYFGKWSDNLPRKNILIGGLITFSITYLGFAYADSLWQFWFLFGIYGIYMAATDGVGKALAVDLIETKNSNLKATGLGLLGTVTGLSTIVASTTAGFLWDSVGPFGPFLYGAVGAILSAILFFILVENKKMQAVS